MQCDFCSSPKVTYRFPVFPFPIGPTHNLTQDDWDACTECAELVSDGKASILIERAVTAGGARSQSTKFDVAVHIRDFFSVRNGPPIYLLGRA